MGEPTEKSRVNAFYRASLNWSPRNVLFCIFNPHTDTPKEGYYFSHRSINLWASNKSSLRNLLTVAVMWPAPLASSFFLQQSAAQSQLSSMCAVALYVGCDPKCSQIHIIYLYFMWSCTWDGAINSKYFLSSGRSPLFSVHFTVMCWMEVCVNC